MVVVCGPLYYHAIWTGEQKAADMSINYQRAQGHTYLFWEGGGCHRLLIETLGSGQIIQAI